MFILILLIKSFHLVPNLPFKNVSLPLFDPKSERPTTIKLVFGHFNHFKVVILFLKCFILILLNESFRLVPNLCRFDSYFSVKIF